MSFFQNPFSSEFRGSWALSDRQASLTFSCPGNAGRSDEIVTSWITPSNGVYDLSGDDSDGNNKGILNIRMTINGGFKDWSNISINLIDNTNASLDPSPHSSVMLPSQIISILNANPVFSSYFTSYLGNFDSSLLKERIIIKQKFPTSRMKFIILNGQAEEVLRFNYKAGVAELPTYFERSKVWGGDMSFPTDDLNCLVLLDTNSPVDENVINNAVDAKGVYLKYNSNSVKEDYELLEGRASGLFTFQKLTVDVSDRITQIIEYPAGAKAGDLARKINYTFSGSNKNPDKVTEIPYLLQNSDMVTP